MAKYPNPTGPNLQAYRSLAAGVADDIKMALGRVISVSPSGYECLVKLGTMRRSVILPCIMSGDAMGQISGASTASQPAENTIVLVAFLDSRSARYGVILCAIPALRNVKLDATKEKACGPALSEEGGAWGPSDQAYSLRMQEADVFRLSADQNRPSDLLPGDWVRHNDTDGALALMRYLTLLRGSARCKLELFGLDDFARLTTGNYQHLNALGDLRMLNDEGNLILEFGATTFQPELAGEEDYVKKDPKLGEFSYAQPGQDYRNMGLRGPEPASPIHRLIVHMGAFGDLLQAWTTVPGLGKLSLLDSGGMAPGDNLAGTSRLAARGDGSWRLDTLSGFAITRSGYIPVPLRIREPWDPDGDGDVEPAAKTQYAFGDEFPQARNLQLEDALAYGMTADLRRFDERAKDFQTPGLNDSELPAIPEEIDRAGTKMPEAEPKTRYRQAGVFVDENGDVILRNASGTEIALVGEDIRISNGRDLYLQSGRNIIGLGGGDVVLKARESMDLLATEKDVRLKAGGAMQLYTEDRGILLQTRSKGSALGYDGQGESAGSRGIVLKAEESTVAVGGRRVVIEANFTLILKSITSRVTTIANNILQLAGTAFEAVCGGSSAVILRGGSAVLTGGSTMMAGDSASIYSGSRVAALEFVPLQGASPKTNWLDNGAKVTYDQEYVLAAELDMAQFTYRTMADCGTDDSEFCVIQTPWQLNPLAATTEWVEEEVSGTFPWPGGENNPQGVYVTLKQQVNVDSAGRPKPRAEQSATLVGFVRKLFNRYYTVRRR